MKQKSALARPQSSKPSRREFLEWSGKAAAASALAGVALPHVHAAEDNTIRLALIGCGGRGTGAARDAFEATGGPVRLVAMADLVETKMAASYKSLSEKYGGQMDVPGERKFLGFDAYRKAIDCLRPGDVAMLTTHAAFRATHFAYAVEKGVNVFMEKTFAPDPGGCKRIISIGEDAAKKNLKVACGVMCRHSVARQALIKKMRDGALGEIQLIRAYRMGGGYALGPRPATENELMWQIRRPACFLWASSGLFIELMIHQIDECCWIKDGWPVAAHGVGGRVANSTDCSQNHDSYSIEYTFADGAKAMVVGRMIQKCYSDFSTYVHGTKCAAQFSGNIHAATVQMYKDQRCSDDNIVWKPEPEPCGPWQAEWNDLLDAIRKNKPYNESRRAALSNLAAIMGRAAVHSGKIITWEEAMASDFKFCADVGSLATDSPAPVQADAQGRYPVPIPGQWAEI
ncbi:MAG: Gfo/Idh/MocA family oxidoreductase [Verrucomicrobia bacterium]|nr:Gfo/Idh/MocA family oxidoreductase [Verrucomicrobiota bacterium]